MASCWERFNAPNRHEADQLLEMMVRKHAEIDTKLAEWLETDVPEGLTVIGFPAEHPVGCERSTAWSVLTVKSIAAHELRRSFAMKPPCAASPPRC